MDKTVKEKEEIESEYPSYTDLTELINTVKKQLSRSIKKYQLENLQRILDLNIKMIENFYSRDEYLNEIEEILR
jgi:formylmethanofuran dehydrogenase subunit E-like metal-binding protein